MLKNQAMTFKARLSHTQVKSKTKTEFFELIIKACAQNASLELRIPETIIKFSVSNTSYLIFTNEEGYLYCKSHIKSS